MNNALEDFITPLVLAERLGISPRRVKADARRLGHCLIVGNRMRLSPADVANLIEAWRPVPQSRAAPSGGYQELVRLRNAQRSTAAKIADRPGSSKRPGR